MSVHGIVNACAKRWSGVLKTPSWSVVYDFSVDVFCKLGIDL
jgi:hypothetical protein